METILVILIVVGAAGWATRAAWRELTPLWRRRVGSRTAGGCAAAGRCTMAGQCGRAPGMVPERLREGRLHD